MSRGKHARRRTSRDRHALQKEIDALSGQIAVERRGLEAARAGAARAQAAQQRLRAHTAAAERALAPAEADAERAARVLGDVWPELCAARAELARFDRRLSRAAPGQLGDAIRAAADSGIRVHLADTHARGTLEFKQTTARRQTHEEVPLTRELVMADWVPPGTGSGRDELAPYAYSRPGDHTRAAMWSWAIPPWMGVPTGHDAANLRAELGATSPTDDDVSGATVPSVAFPGRLRRGAVIDTPWRHRPLLSLPCDAADLAYWYHRSAWSQGLSLPGPSPAHTPTTSSKTADDEAVTEAPPAGPVPFWLPAEHAHGFPRASPLPAETDLRLPFPAVIAVFESGWELPAPEPDDVVPLWPLHCRTGADGAAPTLETVLTRLPPGYAREDLPTPLELIQRYGATVDGLIFLNEDAADPAGYSQRHGAGATAIGAGEAGRPGDTFLWCLSVNHPWGLPMGRIVVAASRRRTTWTRAVENTLAGICLSHWHGAPTRAKSAPEPTHADQRRGETDPSDDTVHVLDVAATSGTPPAADRQAVSGGPRAAHLRRGTWRHQPVGPGRRDRRWVWVRATTVHAHHGGPNRHTIYRLPRK